MKYSCSSHGAGSYSAQKELHEASANLCHFSGQLRINYVNPELPPYHWAQENEPSKRWVGERVLRHYQIGMLQALP